MKDLKPVGDIAIGVLRRIIHLPFTERKGKWIEDDNVDLVSCSECHYGVMRWNANHYCPKCGASMEWRGEKA